LERSLVSWREARLGTLQAKKDSQADRELTFLQKEVDHLLFCLTEFHQILEPFELKDFTYRLNDRFRRAEEIEKETKSDVVWMKPAQTKYAKVLKLVEPKPLVPDKVGVAMTAPGDLYGLAPPERPSVFKRWWFWTAVGAAAAAVGGTVFALTRKGETSTLPFTVTTINIPPQSGKVSP
jgi:hypothetical protein